MELFWGRHAENIVTRINRKDWINPSCHYAISPKSLPRISLIYTDLFLYFAKIRVIRGKKGFTACFKLKVATWVNYKNLKNIPPYAVLLWTRTACCPSSWANYEMPKEKAKELISCNSHPFLRLSISSLPCGCWWTPEWWFIKLSHHEFIHRVSQLAQIADLQHVTA